MPLHTINPECARIQATQTEQLRVITDDLKKLTEIILGNGKPGIQHQVEVNTIALAELIKMSKEDKSNRAEEFAAKKAEDELRKQDVRKWWRGQAASLITMVLIIIQSIIIAIAISKLGL